MSIHSAGQLDVFAAALAESEQVRDELLFANERLRRRNAGLRRSQRAVVAGFDVLDAQTQGRLRELVEQAGDELAGLVHLALDGREASA